MKIQLGEFPASAGSQINAAIEVPIVTLDEGDFYAHNQAILLIFKDSLDTPSLEIHPNTQGLWFLSNHIGASLASILFTDLTRYRESPFFYVYEHNRLGKLYLELATNGQLTETRVCMASEKQMSVLADSELSSFIYADLLDSDCVLPTGEELRHAGRCAEITIDKVLNAKREASANYSAKEVRPNTATASTGTLTLVV